MILSIKSTIATIAILALVGLGVGMSAGAATEGTVNATVTAELVSLTVEDGSVSFGILPVNTNADTVTLGQTQSATNTGNVAINIGVRSSDAIGGTEWNLAATNAAENEFTHEFSSDSGSTWTSFAVDNNVNTSFATDVAAGNAETLDLRIKTPTSVTDNVEKTITVTALATVFIP